MNQVRAVRIRLMIIAGALSLGTLAAWAPATAEAQDARTACTHDAFRLCSDTMPDVERTKACLFRNRASVSPECRAGMSGGRTSARRRHVRH
jgi:hypothetical protein